MRSLSPSRWLFRIGIILIFAQNFFGGSVFGRTVKPKYTLQIEDRPNERRFLLTLTSLDSRVLCIPVEKWPNIYGQLHFGASWARLESGGATYNARDNNFGYCIDKNGGPCLIRLEPGANLKGFIGYAEFGAVSRIGALKTRRLIFPVITWVCGSK